MVGIALLWADLANHFGVSDCFSAVRRDILEADEEEGVGAFDTLVGAVGRGADALAEPAEFVRVGLIPDLVELWVLAELAVVKSLTGGLVEDDKVPLVEKGRGIYAPGGGMS